MSWKPKLKLRTIHRDGQCVGYRAYKPSIFGVDCFVRYYWV